MNLYRMAKKAILLWTDPYIALWSDLYEVVAPRRDKSCGRVADKFGLRTWIFGLTCLVFKTTCIDRRIPLREGAFFFTRTMLFPPLNKRNTHDKARSLCITSERYIGELGVRCLSWINRGQDSRQQSHIGQREELYRSQTRPILVVTRTYIGRVSDLYRFIAPIL